MATIVAVIEWLHILGGITWFGGYIFLDFVVWPALLGMPARAGREAHQAIFPIASRTMSLVAPATVLLGAVRGTILGDLRSMATLATPYGLTWSVALVVSIALMIWGAQWHDHWLGPVWVDDTVSQLGVRRLKRGFAFEMAAFGTILACMVLMAFGN